MTEDSNPEQAQKRLRTRQILSSLADKMASNAVKEPADPSSDSPSNMDARFLGRLASISPTPAGGSAAAYAGAMAAALITMVARITTGSPKYTAVHDRMLEICQRSESLQCEFTLAVDQDDFAYQQYRTARHLPAVTPQEILQKDAGLQKARKETIRLPLELAWKCLDLLKLALACVEQGSYSTICDSRTASLLAETVLRACSNNILFNLKESPEEAYNASIRESFAELNRQGDILLGQVQEQFYLRTEIS